ncbi:MAG: hypothetical protein ABFS32_21755 [Bacteroidota bacterium]
MLASLNYRNENTKNSHWVNVILDYIMDQYQEELTLEIVARKINMDKVYVSKQCYDSIEIGDFYIIEH